MNPFSFTIISAAKLSALLLSAAAFLSNATSARAQGGVPLWTNRYYGPGDGYHYDYATAIAVDSSGNVFVTGSSGNSDTNSDYTTIKYSNAGVPLWTNRYNGPANGEDAAWAIAVDTSGNVFVTGLSRGVDTSNDYATIKYSNSGTPLWTNRYDGPGNSLDGAAAIALDSSGNVFVTGGSWSSQNNVSSDYATLAYSNGGVPLWTNRYDGPGNNSDQASAIAVDGSGNVFVTGGSEGDYVTVAYSTAGLPLWTNRYDGPASGLDSASAIAVDSSGNVFVTGRSNDLYDYATIKYSSEGVPLWTNRYNGAANGVDEALAIAVDNSGNMFVTGGSWGGFPGTLTDYATIKYSSTGVPLWTRRYNGPGNDSDVARAIAVDTAGNVFVTGESYAANGLPPDYVTVAYSNSGTLLWTKRYNGLGNDEDVARAIAVDGNGNVFVTGRSWNGTNFEYVTIKYSSSVPPPRLDFQKLNNQLVLSWTNAGFNLQSATFVTGPFTNLPAATSPYTNVTIGPGQFFRLIGN